MLSRILLVFLTAITASAATPDEVFDQPPPQARPLVMWMWMGSTISKQGITRDLEELKGAGFGGTMLFSLADVCTPWSGKIGNSPTPEMIAFTKPWWEMVRHAAQESGRLGLEMGIHNCAGYESSGGPWITPELSMQEIVCSETPVKGPAAFKGQLPLPMPDLRAQMTFPVYDGRTGLVGSPQVPARREYFRDVAVLAIPAAGDVPKDQIIDLTSRVTVDGHLDWEAPAGEWKIYRFGHTTMGAMIQPAQWEAIGLECDKLNPAAVEFHLRHVIGEMRQHLGEQASAISYLHFDSYEAGVPGWTPAMPAEFAKRRGYELKPWLPVFAGRIVANADESQKFRNDMTHTRRDLFRDYYFPTIRRVLHEFDLQFKCEPYGGPWNVTEIVPHVDRIVTEFWTNEGAYSPFELVPTVEAVRAAGRNIVEAEAFTGMPKDSLWNETPAWLKSMGDAAFCDGVNRMMLHRWPHQPLDERWKPGVVMGQWGTHFERTQTWWEPGKAWVQYLTRCQALLQWGKFAASDFTSEQKALRVIRRTGENADVYFVANVTREPCTARCTFPIGGRQPELWDPVSGIKRDLISEASAASTSIDLTFADSQSYFVVFQKPLREVNTPNFPETENIVEFTGAWSVQFDPKWGGPEKPVEFASLDDWTRHADPGIKYFSGTATYRKQFDLPAESAKPLWLSLGIVKDLANVRINGRDLGVVWCAPWKISILPGLLKKSENVLEIAVTNTWNNRLVGDEQEPADCEWNPGHMGFGGSLKTFPEWLLTGKPRPSSRRYTFTTWNYFTATSPLLSAGLLGPVSIVQER